MTLLAATDAHVLEIAAAALQRGEVVALPTETVYGLVCMPGKASLERLLEVKRRSPDKGLQLLVDSLDQAAQVVLLSEAAELLARTFWPGGLTIVAQRHPQSDLPLVLGGGRPTLGVRLPDHPLPRALARRLGPLAASSANISGFPPATDAAAVVAALGESIGLVVDGGAVRGGVASTVVDCSSPDGRPEVLREGAIAATTIFAALGQDYTSG